VIFITQLVIKNIEQRLNTFHISILYVFIIRKVLLNVLLAITNISNNLVK